MSGLFSSKIFDSAMYLEEEHHSFNFSNDPPRYSTLNDNRIVESYSIIPIKMLNTISGTSTRK